MGMVHLSQGCDLYCFYLEDKDLCIGYDYTTAESETEICKTFLFWVCLWNFLLSKYKVISISMQAYNDWILLTKDGIILQNMEKIQDKFREIDSWISFRSTVSAYYCICLWQGGQKNTLISVEVFCQRKLFENFTLISQKFS